MMRTGEVIGDVTLSRQLDCFAGARFLIVEPRGAAALHDQEDCRGAEPVVALDELSPGRGARVAISEGREAAMPFHPRPMPIDVYCAAVLDQVEVRWASEHG